MFRSKLGKDVEREAPQTSQDTGMGMSGVEIYKENTKRSKTIGARSGGLEGLAPVVQIERVNLTE